MRSPDLDLKRDGVIKGAEAVSSASLGLEISMDASVTRAGRRRMNGTFNGIVLRRITSLKTTTEPSGFKRTAFRVMESSPQLEEVLVANT